MGSVARVTVEIQGRTRILSWEMRLPSHGPFVKGANGLGGRKTWAVRWAVIA